jgi:hypothetical protein
VAAAKKKPARKRKAGMGSKKGAAFEREIAKQFSLWISNDKTQDLLWRSAGSGGRSTLRRKQTGKGIEYHASDIAPLHPDAEPFTGTFTLECKSYQALELRQIIYDWGSSRVAKWWTQAQRDAASVKRIPLMVVKENLKPALLVCQALQYPLMHDWAYLAGPRVYIVDLAKLLATVPFNVFKALHVSGTAHQRSAPDRQPIRRVPLVDFRSPRSSRKAVRRTQLADPG